MTITTVKSRINQSDLSVRKAVLLLDVDRLL